MSRQAIDGTLSPFVFALGQPIYATDMAAVVGQLPRPPRKRLGERKAAAAR